MGKENGESEFHKWKKLGFISQQHGFNILKLFVSDLPNLFRMHI